MTSGSAQSNLSIHFINDLANDFDWFIDEEQLRATYPQIYQRYLAPPEGGESAGSESNRNRRRDSGAPQTPPAVPTAVGARTGAIGRDAVRASNTARCWQRHLS